MKFTFRILFFCLILFILSFNSFGQFLKIGERVIVAGYVFEESTSSPLPYVNVYIKQTRIGTITDPSGYFLLSAKLNDTLTFSSLGYDKKYVVLTDTARENMKPIIVFLDTRIYELGSIDIIALKRYKQLEYDITNMRLPDDDYVYAARNFPFRPADIDYYSRGANPGFGLVFSPITALYDMFSKEGKERRKLEEITERDQLSKIIDQKLSPDLVMKITGLSREDSNVFINWCSFSPDFIKNLNEYDLISVIVFKHKQYIQQNH